MSPTSAVDNRKMKALAICEANRIAENSDGSFSVPSQSKEGTIYQVKLLGQTWVCSCPDFETRADQIEACKHALAVKLWIAARVEIQQKPKPKVFADDALQCGKCGSIKVIKFGTKRGKQSFKCNDCGHRFREQALIKGSRYSPETVSLTLDLYFSGMSLRKIARTVNSQYGTELGASSIYRWIQTFIPKISAYVNELKPTLSETWQADELFVKMKGGVKDPQYNQRNMAFLWNVMDRKTRFLLASKLSVNRSKIAASMAFKEAIANAHDSKPEQIFTDAHRSYIEGIEWAFGQDQPKHIAKMGVGKPHANNNRVERLNGTLRERVKVQRGWKSYSTPIAEGQRIAYNFVKPHMALEGQTPAQAAGIGIEGQNKWLSLLTKALTTPSGTGADTTQ